MLERQLLVGMIEALRINLKNEKDAEIQNEFYKYDPKTPVIRIFVE